MRNALDLKLWQVIDLSIKWKGNDLRPDFDFDGNYNLNLGYNFASEIKQKETEYRLRLDLKIDPIEKETKGYCIKIVILGYFYFYDSIISQEQIDDIVKINGCSILYSTARGYLASCTGPFPSRKLNLPTVDMAQVIRDLDVLKASESKEASEAKT